MDKWNRKVVTYTREEVEIFCVEDTLWQLFREKLKGEPTTRKLDLLDRRLEELAIFASSTEWRRYEVQTSNYINALLRGGQLNSDLEVQR